MPRCCCSFKAFLSPWTKRSYGAARSDQRALVGGDRLGGVVDRHRVARGRKPRQTTTVSRDCADAVDRRLQVLHAHLDRVRDRALRLRLERRCAAVPELRGQERGVQHGRCVAAADDAVHADRGRSVIVAAFHDVVAGRARDGPGLREARVVDTASCPSSDLRQRWWDCPRGKALTAGSACQALRLREDRKRRAPPIRKDGLIRIASPFLLRGTETVLLCARLRLHGNSGEIRAATETILICRRERMTSTWSSSQRCTGAPRRTNMPEPALMNERASRRRYQFAGRMLTLRSVRRRSQYRSQSSRVSTPKCSTPQHRVPRLRMALAASARIQVLQHVVADHEVERPFAAIRRGRSLHPAVLAAQIVADFQTGVAGLRESVAATACASGRGRSRRPGWTAPRVRRGARTRPVDPPGEPSRRGSRRASGDRCRSGDRSRRRSALVGQALAPAEHTGPSAA